jgi:hypothetical protein
MNTAHRKIIKAISNPQSAIDFVGAQTYRRLAEKEFVGQEANRSESEGGSYVAFVRKAVRSYKVFSNFRRHYCYREVLEHVTKEGGLKYLEAIEAQTPQLIENIILFRENDLIGNPIVHQYPKIGSMSPTTLRYIKVASDLLNIFGKDIGANVVEVGVGYGGQLLVNDKVFSFTEYLMYDLPPVLELVAKYLESFILNCSYRLATLNQSAGTETFDLVISNYAFSELPSQLQRMYIKKVLSRCQRGYMTMNSGRGDSDFSKNHLPLAELQKLLPPFEVIEENPVTTPGNYLIVWGHEK